MKEALLRGLPSVDEVLRSEGLREAVKANSTALVTEAVRSALEGLRAGILSGSIKEIPRDLAPVVEEKLKEMLASSIVRVVNATGTILHTNIGRAVLSKEAIEAAVRASGNINLEFDLGRGERGERDSLVEPLVKKLTGAEAACVVNNNAAAVLLALNTLAEGREVIISRGELIEIGGSFRLPEIIKKSGCVLREVGTTNRTHLKDFTSAVTQQTALFLKAHTSNYLVVGFTAEVGLKELVEAGRNAGIPVVEDLGSGSLVDLSAWGLPKEPLVRESLEAGADIVTFSGDKLLGGPQAGIIAGKKELVERIKKNPLKRAMRADKLTLAALEATLRLYLNKERLADRLPTLGHMARPLVEIEKTAVEAARLLRTKLGGKYVIEIEDGESVVGGGSLPGHNLPTKVISITHPETGPDRISRLFMSSRPPILGRVKKEKFLLDMRTVETPQDVVPE